MGETYHYGEPDVDLAASATVGSIFGEFYSFYICLFGMWY